MAPESAPAAEQAPLKLKDRSFLEWVEKEAKTSVSSCYQCQKCTCGCPTAQWMDILPHQAVHMIELGMKDEILKSRTIWICADCKTCVTRCPNGVDIPGFMEVLKRHSQKEGIAAGEKNVPIFNQAFIDSIRKRGRIHELGMMQQYKMRSGDLFSDLMLGFTMFRKGKIKILAHGKLRGIKEIRGFFEKMEKGK